MSRVWQPATEQSAHLSPEKWALLFHTFLWPHAFDALSSYSSDVTAALVE